MPNHPQIVIPSNGSPAFLEILSPDALRFVADLMRHFGPTRADLLERRLKTQVEIDGGAKPDFLNETREIRTSEWTVASVPLDLQDRRVEITGPVDRKMIINALNSGAKVFMADFEDSHSPTWSGTIQGQINLRDAVRGTISLESGGKSYRLNREVATLMVRPRGWHLVEKHVLVDGVACSASLFDFGLFFFHNARHLVEKGSGPYFYLPKLESHLEARLWNDVFIFAQKALGLPSGTIKATVLIETILAAFEMDEILFELKDHSAGLNCGRWDYIFSFIKKFRNRADLVLPDRAQVTMQAPFLKAYSELLVRTCHHRKAHAMGGMAAQIPIKNDLAANQAAFEKVVADKQREASAGHDGTWVAHPGLVPVAKEVFDALMPMPNQIHLKRLDVEVTRENLLSPPTGTITERGLRTNISVGLQYLEAWLNGNGCVPLNNLMEDAATAEISRAQIWQWIRHPNGRLEDGRKVTKELVRALIIEELAEISQDRGTDQKLTTQFKRASEIFDTITTSDNFTDFLTLIAYDHIVEGSKT